MCRPARSPETPARRSRASAAPRVKEAVRELCSGEAARGRRGREQGGGGWRTSTTWRTSAGRSPPTARASPRDLPPVVKVRARAGLARPGPRRAAPMTSRRERARLGQLRGRHERLRRGDVRRAAFTARSRRSEIAAHPRPRCGARENVRVLAQRERLRVHGRPARGVRVRAERRRGGGGRVGGEHVHGEEPEPVRDEHVHHQSEERRQAAGRRRVRPAGRQERARAGRSERRGRDADRPHRGGGGAHDGRTRRAAPGKEGAAEPGSAEGAAERTRRDFAAQHGMPRRVHVLQDQARAR